MSEVIYPSFVIERLLRVAHRRIFFRLCLNMSLDVQRSRPGFYYVLDGNFDPVPCPDVELFSYWMQQADEFGWRKISYTEFPDNVSVSTVFRGLASPFRAADGGPGLYETMVFGGKFDELTSFWSSRWNAQLGHALICHMVLGRGEISELT